MATKKASLKLTPALRKGIQEVRREVFGHLPQLHQRTGHQFAKKQLTAVYLNQYYIDPIEKFARKVSACSSALFYNQKLDSQFNPPFSTGYSWVHDGTARTTRCQIETVTKTGERPTKKRSWCKISEKEISMLSNAQMIHLCLPLGNRMQAPTTRVTCFYPV